MITLDAARLQQHELDEAARQFNELGFIEVVGLERVAVPAFESVLAERLGFSAESVKKMLSPAAGSEIFPLEVRQRLSRIPTPPDLAATLVSALGPLVSRLIGPLVHVSRDFHSQFKGGAVAGIDHYHHEGAAEYLEVHGAYLLHQDFTGASVPTSPCGLTLWIAMNDCATSPLWVYPGSHRFGLVCNRMWQRNDPRLSAFAAPVEFQARVGSGLLFNSLLVHGTGPAGPGRRASCDIRFLPLCGFLGTKVHMLDENPIQAIQAALDRNEGEFLCAPRRDNLAWLGMAGEPSGVPPLSPLNWAGYVTNRLNENDDRARSFLDRMVNSTVSGEPVSAFCRMWRSRDIDRPAVQGVRENLLGAAQVGG